MQRALVLSKKKVEIKSEANAGVRCRVGSSLASGQARLPTPTLAQGEKRTNCSFD